MTALTGRELIYLIVGADLLIVTSTPGRTCAYRGGAPRAPARTKSCPASPPGHWPPRPRRPRLRRTASPGPVVIATAFIGYLVGGATGVLVATIAIYLGVVLPRRWFIRHRGSPQLKAFVTGAAAAGGALCGTMVVLTRQAVIDLPATAIAP
ncbi:hypothetical protein ACWEQC_26065 [Streptomyces shenzhenensis]